MVNLKVLNIKEIIKYLGILIVVVVFIFLFFSKVKSLLKDETSNEFLVVNKIQAVSNENLIGLLNIGAPLLDEKSWQKKQIPIIDFSSVNILKYELGLLSAIKEKIIEDKEEEEVDVIQENLNQLLEGNKAETEVQQSEVKENYTFEVAGVKVKNKSGYDISEADIDLNYAIDDKNIIIFHTHTCESYTATEEESYKASGNFRTTDLNFSVSRVGDELTDYLKKLNFNVVHDKTYHDHPAYSGSYDRAYKTIEKLLEETSADLIIDIHRDAVESDSSYAPTVKINDELVSQLMFVIGTDAGGLEHDNWKNNLSVAVQIQEKANELYPGLFKPISLTKSRYNQNLGDAACIIEVGATGNTLEQSMASMKYLAIVIDKIVNNN